MTTPGEPDEPGAPHEVASDLATPVGEPADEPAVGVAPAVAVAPGAPQPEPAWRRGRIGGLLGRIHRPRFRSRRSLMVLFFLMAGLGSVVTVGGALAIQWTETADFCGRCHTMGPELKAHAMSPHRDVACAECHVEPGLGGWVKAKINGTRQLLQILTGTYPTPIPPPDHGDLPPTSATCLRCHDVAPLVANGGPVNLVLQVHYREDEPNTRDSIALVIRPFGFGSSTATRGMHWHIVSDVEYYSSDPRAQKIDLVRITNKDGTTEQFLASQQVGVATNVQPDLDRLQAAERSRRMDCLDCHNRIGHRIPGLNESIDNAIDLGQIDQSLPYVKREAVARLSVNYASSADADRAIDQLRDFYANRYPLVAQTRAAAVNSTIAELKTIYELVATPDMRVTAATYPDNLGHQTSPGCFRCHDGAHYKVVSGALTNETIPSACATCHTFPQIGSTQSGILIGYRPDTHNDRLWVFDHKSSVTKVDPAGQTCGTCHTRTYCENCHNTPAVNVSHEDMVYNHAKVAKQTGLQACVFCHQPAYCDQCHLAGMLPSPAGDGGGTPAPSPSAPASLPPDVLPLPEVPVPSPSMRSPAP